MRVPSGFLENAIRIGLFPGRKWSMKFDTVTLLYVPTQMPPLTPGTNKKLTEVLYASFASWEKVVQNCRITKDPRQWTPEHVIIWLNWSITEFSLESVNKEPFLKMSGRDIIGLGREGFLAIAPPFTGDILWEHLEILQKVLVVKAGGGASS
ncbi:hypothetical protein RP20_CCG019070 [Aedes albopictus]|nr:hypothetical protein RP20_CCG019070 [Aedes albopictus]